MHSTIQLIDLLGAGALLLWGLRLIKTGVMRAFGASLRQWIAKGTGNRFTSVLSGVAATLALQSSTATAVITASFAARGVIDPKMAQAVMLGANVGTSIAAVILSMNVEWFGSAMILVGVMVFSLSNYARGKGIGRALLGLGLMLLALQLVGNVTGPLRESEVVITVLKGLGDAPVFALMLSAFLAFVSSSSLAVVLFVALLAQAGIVTPPLAVILVAGANLGGAVPPFLAVLSEGAQARRLTLANLIVRALGAIGLTIVAIPVASLLASFLPDTRALTIAAHIGFNVALLLIFLPLLGPIARLAALIVPIPAQPEKGANYLDETVLDTPTIALAGAARETLRVSDLVLKMLERSRDALQKSAPDTRTSIGLLDDDVDALHQSIKLYLTKLDRTELDEEDGARSAEIMSYAINLEHVGDIIEGGLAEIAAKKTKRQLVFTAEGLAEIIELYEKTIANMQLSQTVFLTRDPQLARRLVAEKVEVRRLEAQSSKAHLQRVRQRVPEAVQTSSLHLDTLRDLKRINAHLASVAYPILESVGELRESRLRPTVTAEAPKTASE
ncbi:sodium:phosphate symporter [Devosia limi DSM 17137]|uniref:Phosphate:Na+ symporter n=1 Tax=Devosia limi DSM 17137 TaxID=1121477 RepID=A0A0F5LWF8_9HYPH|nr:Na/Pi cotransporter family protein [Devosia limi]KKB86658.1 sodium:phosphate symporter [Devosia limi DSM 17137]SHE36537.1 phosphate:Na+ symporter [Devosia limi DSM 17137]